MVAAGTGPCGKEPVSRRRRQERHHQRNFVPDSQSRPGATPPIVTVLLACGRRVTMAPDQEKTLLPNGPTDPDQAGPKRVDRRSNEVRRECPRWP